MWARRHCTGDLNRSPDERLMAPGCADLFRVMVPSSADLRDIAACGQSRQVIHMGQGATGALDAGRCTEPARLAYLSCLAQRRRPARPSACDARCLDVPELVCWAPLADGLRPASSRRRWRRCAWRCWSAPPPACTRAWAECVCTTNKRRGRRKRQALTRSSARQPRRCPPCG